MSNLPVIPAKAEIQAEAGTGFDIVWTPAFAGMAMMGDAS